MQHPAQPSCQRSISKPDRIICNQVLSLKHRHHKQYPQAVGAATHRMVSNITCSFTMRFAQQHQQQHQNLSWASSICVCSCPLLQQHLESLKPQHWPLALDLQWLTQEPWGRPQTAFLHRTRRRTRMNLESAIHMWPEADLVPVAGSIMCQPLFVKTVKLKRCLDGIGGYGRAQIHHNKSMV